MFFLSCGARGYVGTLWAIENDAAIVAARTFYTNVFTESVLTAFHRATKALDATNAKDIYLYWGLHFTTLSPARSVQESHREVLTELRRSTARWIAKIRSTKGEEVKRNSVRVLKAILRDLLGNFPDETRGFLEAAKNKFPHTSGSDFLLDRSEGESDEVRSSLDFPTVYRKKET